MTLVTLGDNRQFAIQLVIVSMSFHLLQSAQFLVNLLYAFSKNQIGEIAILAHIVLAVNRVGGKH